MPYVPLIPVGRIVMTWIWSFSCDVSMKNILTFAWLFFFFYYCLAVRSNVDLATLPGLAIRGPTPVVVTDSGGSPWYVLRSLGSAGSERIGVSFEVFVLGYQERIYYNAMNWCIILICLCVSSVSYSSASSALGI
jgi:hypothetical protein